MRAAKAVGLALLVFVWLCPSAQAAAAWTVEQLAEALARAPRERIAFEEQRYIPALQDPVVLSGFLLRPSDERLEKHILQPMRENFVIDGNTVSVSDDTGETLRFDIAGHPVLHAVAHALRGLLNGRLEGIRERFTIDLAGTPADWQLRLHPSDEAVRAGLTLLRLDGRNGEIRRIETLESDGGRSVLELLPAP